MTDARKSCLMENDITPSAELEVPVQVWREVQLWARFLGRDPTDLLVEVWREYRERYDDSDAR